ncbi:MAG: NADP-dependent phosphogluconate dehydrogenase [Planctomycetaceae bacterium]|nr:NADP-dependent phosphogluconate dehydrogenase [Planctomycetaceae bacterium]
MHATIGLIGLAVMGRNLALNLADHGHRVAVYNRTVEKTLEFVASPEAEGRELIACRSIEELLGTIAKPAPIILMIKAGDAVDQQIDQLRPLLAKGDILMDGGNSYFADTRRRCLALEADGYRYLGVGISGGEEGARTGPSIMPGGSRDAYSHVETMLTDISAKVDGQPCCAYIGPDGAGHYVKMVHNGIEYADMQLIAEAYYFLRHVAGLEYDELRDVFAEWNRGELSSYLIEITADILGRVDPETGKPMVEVIMDKAGQKGTGAWTGQSALALGVPTPTVAEAVFARSLSALRDERLAAAGVLAGPEPFDLGDRKRLVAMVRDALYAGKICCYAQGFSLLAEAGREYGWDLDLGGISMLWRGGCIIRAAFLSRIRDAYARRTDLGNLLLDDYFVEAVASGQAGWREVVALAARRGVPVPAFASALSYYDGYRTGYLWANLIQAQRDYFGAHTYQRVDRAGVFHTDWLGMES